MNEERAIVRAGYDVIAETYRSYRIDGFSDEERAFLDRVRDAIPDRGDILELGCGAGEPFTAALAGRGRVTGVDVSERQLALARTAVPTARFLLADMANLHVRPASFDAVVAIASIIHVPRESHAELLRRIATWLRPDGVFAAEVGSGDNPQELEPDWMGAPMYWSHFDADGTLALVRDAGLEIEEARDVHGREHDGTASHWIGIIARRPR
jgi:SAM-dependent methyltransferase